MPTREIALEELRRLSQTDSDVLNDTLIQHSERSLEELRSWLDNADAMADILRDQEPAPNNHPAITQEMLNRWYTVIQLNRLYLIAQVSTLPPQSQGREQMQQLLLEQRALVQIQARQRSLEQMQQSLGQQERELLQEQEIDQGTQQLIEQLRELIQVQLEPLPARQQLLQNLILQSQQVLLQQQEQQQQQQQQRQEELRQLSQEAKRLVNRSKVPIPQRRRGM